MKNLKIRTYIGCFSLTFVELDAINKAVVSVQSDSSKGEVFISKYLADDGKKSINKNYDSFDEALKDYNMYQDCICRKREY